MLNKRAGTQYVLSLLLALSLTACNSESENSEPEASAGTAGVSLKIESPTNTSTMDTTDTSVVLAGTAGSDAGVVKVSWTSEAGDEGNANGTESWETGSIDLSLGDNNITVTAEDASGAATSRSILINRESGEKSSATLSWSAPTERTDGSALTNLAGYRIFYGRMSGIYDYEIEIDNPGLLTYVVEDLGSGDWYFSLSAYDTEGLESDRSEEVLREIS